MRSTGETPSTLASRSKVSVVTERYGSLNSVLMVEKLTSDRCDSLVMEMPFAWATSFILSLITATRLFVRVYQHRRGLSTAEFSKLNLQP